MNVRLDGLTAKPPGFDPAGATVNDTFVQVERMQGSHTGENLAEVDPGREVGWIGGDSESNRRRPVDRTCRQPPRSVARVTNG